MKTASTLGAAAASLIALAVWAEEPAGNGWYAGGAAQLALPQGGSRMRRLGGGAARAVWHLHGWGEFDMLFGYERFDPFLSAGAKGWIHDGQVGPSAGLGAFYYLTDDWALRFDAEATLGLDTRVETVYSISAGIQWFF